MAFFSIIIPTFNSSATIIECLKSILKQSFTNFEILVLDSISKDNTLSKINDLNDPRIKIYCEQDYGVYDAMNKGIDKATGKWLYFLGSDDELCSEIVFDEVATFIEANDPDFVYGDVILRSNGAKYDGIFDLYKLTNQCNICHQAIFYKASTFTQLGKYNLKYKIYADWDFNIRSFMHPDLKKEYIPISIALYNDIDGVSKGFNPFDEEKYFLSLLPINILYENDNLKKELSLIKNGRIHKATKKLYNTLKSIKNIFK